MVPFEYTKIKRIRFARASISRAKVDMKRLVEISKNTETEYLLSKLTRLQRYFREHFAKIAK